MAVLCQDKSERVREALYGLVGGCMTEMAEAADYETLLMPYLLTGLADSNESNRTLCQSYVDKLAAQYRKDHLDEIEEAERYAPPPSHVIPIVLSHFPYSGRPSLSLQLRLRAFVDRLFPALLSELSDWKVEVRSDSVRLLRTLLWVEERSVGAQWRSELLTTAIRIHQHAEHSEQRLRRDQRDDCDADAETETELVWSEVMRLVARYDGVEVMRVVRSAREEGQEVGVMAVLPALLAGWESERVDEVAEEVESWLSTERSAAVLSRAQFRRKVRVYAALLNVVTSTSLARIMDSLQQLLETVRADDSKELTRSADRASALLDAARQKFTYDHFKQ